MKSYNFRAVAAPLCRGVRVARNAATERRGYSK
jgi:hypothetical protein